MVEDFNQIEFDSVQNRNTKYPLQLSPKSKDLNQIEFDAPGDDLEVGTFYSKRNKEKSMEPMSADTAVAQSFV